MAEEGVGASGEGPGTWAGRGKPSATTGYNTLVAHVRARPRVTPRGVGARAAAQREGRACPPQVTPPPPSLRHTHGTGSLAMPPLTVWRAVVVDGSMGSPAEEGAVP